MPYDPNSGMSMIEYMAACDHYMQKGGDNMAEVTYSVEIDIDEINRLRNSQRNKGDFVKTATKAAEGKVGDTTIVQLSDEDTSFANHVSGYNRAIDKLKLEDKLELIKDKDANRLILFVKS